MRKICLQGAASKGLLPEVYKNRIGSSLSKDEGSKDHQEDTITDHRPPTGWSGFLDFRELGMDETQSWKDKDEAGRQPPDDGDDSANVWYEQGQEESEEEPAACLEEAPVSLPHHIFFHCLPLVAQPEALQDSPATKVQNGV